MSSVHKGKEMKMRAGSERFLKAFLNLGKMILAGAIVAAIGFAFVVFDDPTGEVSTAEADLWSVFTRETSNHTKFMNVLKKEGMEPPRQYDYNGNQVYFSYATTRESPRQVMHRFQEAFVREGLNKHFHPGVRKPVDPGGVEMGTVAADGLALQSLVGADDLFTGGMIPVVDTRNQMMMVGLQTKGGAKDLMEALSETQGGKLPLENVLGALRYLDATREEGSLQTTITAVWSDEHLDMNKFRSLRQSDRTAHPVEMLIPVCGGCERVARLSGTGDEENMHNLLYRSRRSVHEITRDFDRNMGKYGWQPEPAMNQLNRLQREGYAPDRAAQIRSYMREGLNLTMIIYPDFNEGRTYVKMITST